MTGDRDDGSGSTTDLTLPTDLVGRIERRLDHTDFESPDEYAAFVLSTVLARVEHDVGGTDAQEAGTDDDGATASPEDVRDRLRSLGYLEE